MKICQTCGQALAEKISLCPSCGSEVTQGRKSIDDYRIDSILHEGHSSILCRAFQAGSDQPVMIRIFTGRSGVNETVAERLKQELGQIQQLPDNFFVKHIAIRQSAEGLWYRVSEWVEVEHWGNLLTSGRLLDRKVAYSLFYRVASILEGLHQTGHFMPHLILDDIIAFKGDCDELCVKIDYKFSRFLDPRIVRPAPMLKKLIDQHPDIVQERPLDFRSDIWSLGKIFVELLSGDLDTTEYHAKIPQLGLPHDEEVLLKVMLADDPALRPRSMADVAQTLARILKQPYAASTSVQIEDRPPPSASQDAITPASDPRPESTVKDQSPTTVDQAPAARPAPSFEMLALRKHLRLLSLTMVIMVALGGFSWFYFARGKKDVDGIFGDYANRYASSIAFVVSDYWLKDKDRRIYHNRTEGTAFLVDDNGYMLTNRHVVCPWLEDSRLFFFIRHAKSQDRPVQFGYQVSLWFEGAKAFKRLPVLSSSADLADTYYLDAAFRTNGYPRLTIAGVARAPVKTWQLMKLPLKDDFAVLKIDPVPTGAKPLPLAQNMDVLNLPKLSPVITLGFPLGNRTQADTINVSVTRGNVRRSFAHSIQVDTSIHSGNSGGPMIDLNGRVIGIASSVAMQMARGPVPVATMLSDIGMVLPISQTFSFLKELKAGQPKWNGVLDLSLEEKLKRISDTASKRRWDEARNLAEKELKLSFNPSLVLATAMMQFCSRDYPNARTRFEQALSIDRDNEVARLMLYIIDWHEGRAHESDHRRALIDLDWCSTWEFFGHLVRVIEGALPQEEALKGGYTDDEQGWLYYVAGLLHAQKQNFETARSLLRTAVQKADGENWTFLLALAKLDQVQTNQRASLGSETQKDTYLQDNEKFFLQLVDNQAESAKRQSEIEPLIAKLKQTDTDAEQNQEIRDKLLNQFKIKGKLLASLVYYAAINEAWDQSLEYARHFLEKKGRENLDRLRIGLMEPQIMLKLGRTEEATAKLQAYIRDIHDPWYRALGEAMIATRPQQSLLDEALDNPAYLVTAHTALGFWSEGNGDTPSAMNHYREALTSYRDDMFEYEFARERIKKLQK